LKNSHQLVPVVNGNEVYRTQLGYGAKDVYSNSVFFIVPPGATYSVNYGGTGSLEIWSELR